MGRAVLSSEITIGKFQFSGVHNVVIKRGLHGIEDYASIEVPSVARIVKGRSSSPARLTTATLFTDGEPVTIKLGYDGVLKEEFRGFVRRRSLSMPLVVECEGYVRLLRLKTRVTATYKQVSARTLLEHVCEGTGIKVVCPVDFQLGGIVIPGIEAVKVIEHIKTVSQRILTIFFIEPDVLWCGLVYTPYMAGQPVFNLPTAKYRLGWNVVKDNSLRERLESEPVEIIINGLLATGDTVRTASKDKTAKRRVKFILNNMPDPAFVRALAEEKQKQMNYRGYDGSVNAFLEPFCLPGYNVVIKDDRYPERDGTYLCESTEVRFGVNGARRKVEIGPKIS